MNNGNTGRVYALLLEHPEGLHSRTICERLGIDQRQLDSVVDPSKRNSKLFVRVKDPGLSGGKWSNTRRRYFADKHANLAVYKPVPLTLAKPTGGLKLSSGPADYSKAKVQKVPHSVDERFVVQKLPKGYVSQLSAKEARPWVEAVV